MHDVTQNLSPKVKEKAMIAARAFESGVQHIKTRVHVADTPSTFLSPLLFSFFFSFFLLFLNSLKFINLGISRCQKAENMFFAVVHAS